MYDLCMFRFHTEESLKRSPFRSPFYSGRTSFGGAASGQKPRVKRPRTESSPPVVNFTPPILPPSLCLSLFPTRNNSGISMQLIQCARFTIIQPQEIWERSIISPSLRYLIFLLEEAALCCGLPYSHSPTPSPSFPPLQVTPLRLSVTARPVSSSLGSKGHHSLVTSQTARKIMESLGNLSSPLANARKLPMRATPLLGETQVL